MRILPYSVIPIFLGRPSGNDGAALRYFDVFYRTPPVVGFHVICCPPPPGVAGFVVEGEAPDSSHILGFSVSQDRPEETVVGFYVEEKE